MIRTKWRDYLGGLLTTNDCEYNVCLYHQWPPWWESTHYHYTPYHLYSRLLYFYHYLDVFSISYIVVIKSFLWQKHQSTTTKKLTYGLLMTRQFWDYFELALKDAIMSNSLRAPLSYCRTFYNFRKLHSLNLNSISMNLRRRKSRWLENPLQKSKTNLFMFLFFKNDRVIRYDESFF